MDEQHRRRGARGTLQMKARLLEQAVALLQVARRTRCDDVLPDGVAALRARDDVVEREPAARRAAVDAAPAIAGEQRAAEILRLITRGTRTYWTSRITCGHGNVSVAERRPPSSRAPRPCPSTRAHAHAEPSRRSAARNSRSGREPVAWRSQAYQPNCLFPCFSRIIGPWRARPLHAPRARARSVRGLGRAP